MEEKNDYIKRENAMKMMSGGNMHLAVSDNATIQSSLRMLQSAKSGHIKKHNIMDRALPFSEKENSYLLGFSRMLKTRNYKYVLECKGDTEDFA